MKIPIVNLDRKLAILGRTDLIMLALTMAARQEEQGVVYSNDQAAAETLVNLRSRLAASWSNGNHNTWRGTSDSAVTCRQGYQNHDSMAYNSQTKSSALAGGENSAIAQNVNPSSHAYLYSDINIQNTISGLSNAMEGMQAQHVYIHSKQELMSNALQQVMTMLQQLTKEKKLLPKLMLIPIYRGRIGYTMPFHMVIFRE